jgi:hypothetical protein
VQDSGLAPGFSQHPVDRLIRELIATRRVASPADVAAILDRMATAPFDPRDLPVPLLLQRLTYLGRTLGNRAPAISIHLVQRVIGDRQWVYGTTARTTSPTSDAPCGLHPRR